MPDAHVRDYLYFTLIKNTPLERGMTLETLANYLEKLGLIRQIQIRTPWGQSRAYIQLASSDRLAKAAKRLYPLYE